MEPVEVILMWALNNYFSALYYFILMQDRFADGRSLPPVDNQQNWFLLNAEEEGGYTTLEFTRNYTSCDTRDRNIKVSGNTPELALISLLHPA